MATPEATRTIDARWPRWTWVVLPALAIALGGSAGWIVGGDEAEPRAQAVQARPANTPIVEPIAPAHAQTAQPDPQIEVDPDPTPATHGTMRPAAKPRPQPQSQAQPHKTKPLKTRPCNVYDHMDGC